MKVGHIVSTMYNENIEKLIDHMNLKCNSLIINQADEINYKKISCKDSSHDVYTFEERGVGLSRNNGLIRSNFDISVMSDDDMKYVDNYVSIIEDAYNNYPDADMIIFNVRIHEKDGRVRLPVKKSGRVHLLNCLRYGTVTFSFRTDVIKRKNIHFSLLFGGGAKYCSGEDSLFIWNCIRSGMKVYCVDTVIADVYNEESSWFTGYNEKYFLDRGSLFKALSNRLYWLLILQFVIRRKPLYKNKFTMRQVIDLMLRGAKKF